MSIVLYHHPQTRARTVLWMLDDLGLEHELRFVDLREGAQKAPDFLALNPMGKVPTLVDGDVVVTEVAAIGLYLADRYSLGRLAPATDDPQRAAYLRWILFGPSVMEPCAYARAAEWTYRPGSAGWGTWQEMHSSIERAIGSGPWLLGERFSMADLCFGATLRFLLQFGMLEKRPAFLDYVARLEDRPAFRSSDATNQRVLEARGGA